MIWRNLLELNANINLTSSQKHAAAQPARVPCGGEETFEIISDFFEMPDDFMEFFGGHEEDSVAPHLGSSSA